MSAQLEAALVALADRISADAVVVWCSDGDVGRVLAAAPTAMFEQGTNWHAASVASGTTIVVTDRAALARAVPTFGLLALSEPLHTVASVAMAGVTFSALWTQAPTPDAIGELEAAVSGGLDVVAIDLQRRRHVESEHGRLNSMMHALDHAVIVFDNTDARAMVNSHAAALLQLGRAGDHSAFAVMTSFQLLRARAVYPSQVDDLVEKVLSDPDCLLRDVVVRLTGPVQYVRVSTTPLRANSSDGRIWTFDDVTAEMLALARVEAAADEVAESRSRYQLLAQHASDIVFRSSADGLLDWVSDSVRDVLGYEPDSLQGDLFLAKLHPDDLEAVAGKGAHFIGEDRATFRGRLLTAWGSYRWLEITARLVPSPDGQAQFCIGSARNIDAEVVAEQALAESDAVMGAIVDAMLDPHVLLEPIHDEHGVVQDFRYGRVNAAAVRYLALERGAIEGRTMVEFLPEGYDDTLVTSFVDAFATGAPLVIDGFHYQSDRFGMTRYFDIRGTRVGDRMSVTWRDVTDRLVLAQRLEHAARTDPLTGVLNRAAGVELAGAKLQARRLPGNHVALLFCDIDHFKELNDAFGHRSGDIALQTMADRIREVVRGGDVVSRLGGDEFLVVLDGVHGPDDAVAIGEKVRKACSSPIVIDHGVIRPSMSVGAVVGEHGDDFDVLLARADAAMYVAKGAGRNRVVLASSPDRVSLVTD